MNINILKSFYIFNENIYSLLKGNGENLTKVTRKWINFINFKFNFFWFFCLKIFFFSNWINSQQHKRKNSFNAVVKLFFEIKHTKNSHNMKLSEILGSHGWFWVQNSHLLGMFAAKKRREEIKISIKKQQRITNTASRYRDWIEEIRAWNLVGEKL